MADSRIDAFKKLGGMIKDVKFAMLTTIAEDGTLRSRPMATQKEEFNGDLWFFTRADSDKVHQAEHDNHVNVAYSNPDDQQYVSVNGRAELVRDKAKIEELWNPIYKAWFPLVGEWLDHQEARSPLQPTPPNLHSAAVPRWSNRPQPPDPPPPRPLDPPTRDPRDRRNRCPT